MELSSQSKKGNKKIVNQVEAMVYGKMPPQDISLEDAILGAMMLEQEAVPLVFEIIKTPDIFYSDANRYIYESIISLYDKRINIDILTVVTELKKQEKLDLVGGPIRLTQITKDVVSSAHIEDHCRLLIEYYLRREIIKVSGRSIGDAYEEERDVFQLYTELDKSLINAIEIAESGATKDVRYYTGNVAQEYIRTKEVGTLGLQTKLFDFDRIFCGLVAPDFFVIAARPGAGKTAFCLSLVNNICVKDKKPVAFFSLEMDGAQLVRRLASIDSNIDHSLIRSAKIPDYDLEKFYVALDRIKEAPLFIEDKVAINIRDLRTKAHILKRKHNIGLIIIDYLQLMSGTNKAGANREQEISEISRGVKALAKELNVPIIGLSQLSRAVESRSDKMPVLSDLRESGSIEQDADEVMFLMRPEYYGFTEEVEISGVMYSPKDLVIAKAGKNRHGPTENFALTFNGPTMHFRNRENPNENFNNGQPSYTQPSIGFASVNGNVDDMPF